MYKILCGFIYTLILLLFPRPVSAGELSWSEISAFSEWSSTECSEPGKPAFACYDTFSCESSVEEYNDYVTRIQRYMDCIGDEISQDSQEMSTILEEAYEAVDSKAASDLEDARRDLENELEVQGYYLR